jgi:hypothetical protein
LLKTALKHVPVAARCRANGRRVDEMPNSEVLVPSTFQNRPCAPAGPPLCSRKTDSDERRVPERKLPDSRLAQPGYKVGEIGQQHSPSCELKTPLLRCVAACPGQRI